MNVYLIRTLFSGCLTLFFCTILSCSSTRSVGSGELHHIVLCWLREPGNIEARDRIIRASYDLASIPGVISVVAGTAVQSDRPVVDDSFDVAVEFTLRDSAALAAYLIHPDHRKAVAEVLGPLSDRILIYDFAVRK